VVEVLDFIFGRLGNHNAGAQVAAIGLFPVTSFAHHSVPFLDPAMYAKFFFPYFEKIARPVAEAGGTLFLRSEGDSSYAFEFYKDYLKQSFLYLLENEDPMQIHKVMGDDHTYMGGMTTEQLKYGTSQECIDSAERVLTSLAQAADSCLQ